MLVMQTFYVAVSFKLIGSDAGGETHTPHPGRLLRELRSWATLKLTQSAAAATTKPFILVLVLLGQLSGLEDEVVSRRVRCRW